MNLVYDRETAEVMQQEDIGDGFINWLYGTKLGRCLLKVATSSFVSEVVAIYFRSCLSKRKAEAFIAKYELSNFLIDKLTYAGVFARKQRFNRKALVDSLQSSEVPSVCQAKVSYYKIEDGLVLNIKHSRYTLQDLVGRKLSRYLSYFQGGSCLVFRLSVQDYHRFLAIDDMNLLCTSRIKGCLHTVRPISGEYNVYARNKRVASAYVTKHFGMIMQIEVGALGVGRIVHNKQVLFERLEEVGRFELGGSTIIVLLDKNAMICDDIVEHSSIGIETVVNVGDKVGDYIRG